jgi:2-(1,2-epoxy-1,2-dihydrophenyl)acetyl-CoA isomerase
MPPVPEGSGTAPVVLVDRVGAVTTITLNRPDRGNALTAELKTKLLAAISAAGEDTAVRAVVVTGAGPAFCAGQDLAEHAAALAEDPSTAFATIEQHYAPIVTALATMSKPVLAAINGTCVGAGLGIALACDLRIASAGARLATAFSAIGLTCDSGLSATLVRAVGAARASELILLGEPVTAEQAVEWGLVSRVVDADDLPTAAAELATRLAAGPTLAFAESKRAIAAAVDPPLNAVLGSEAEAQRRLGVSTDHGDAVAAFLAKRKPEFHGR